MAASGPLASGAAVGNWRVVALAIADPGSGRVHQVEFELELGQIYHAVVGSTPVREAMIEKFADMPFAAIVPADGGLIGNLKVWENLVLPAAYHGSLRSSDLETQAAAVLAGFGISGAKFEVLCTTLPDHLDRFERRLCAFVRAMLTQPRLMVYDSLFDGLTREETAKVLQFDQSYRARFPGGTSVHLTADLPQLPDVGAHRTFHL